MFVITADQRDSRTTGDAVAGALESLNARWASDLSLPAERTAGDELQLLTRSASAALTIMLDLNREGRWSTGLGLGAVETPLGANVRASRGPAFVAARDAVERAKRSQTHCAVGGEPPHPEVGHLEALLDLLLLLRQRRTEPGWELHALVADGLSQQEAAERLGITAQSASQRARTAGLRAEDAATEALVSLLTRVDALLSTREGGVT